MMYTQQEIVDKVWARLNDGTGQALQPFTGESGMPLQVCSYLTDSGIKCAVGIFIPEGHDAQKFEGDVFSLLFQYEKDEVINWMYKHKDLLYKLQSIHDLTSLWDETKFIGIDSFKDVCKDFGLKFPG